MLPTLQAIGTLSLLANDIENGVDQLRTLGVVCESSERQYVQWGD